MPNLIFLHGWGTHPIIWAPMQERFPGSKSLPLPGYAQTPSAGSFEQTVDRVAGEIDCASVVVGWSLGAQVAMRIALDHPHKVSRLVLIGATPCFVSREDWIHGVADEIFEQFSRNLGVDYAGTIRRFLSLQAQGSDSVREVLTELRKRLLSQPKPAPGVLEMGLALLRQNDMRQQIASLQIPVSLIHGTGDKLAPVSAAHWLQKNLPRASLHEIKGAGHAPFLSHPQQVAEVIAGG